MADIDALVTANVDLPEKYDMVMIFVKLQHYWQAVKNLKTEADQIGMKTPEYEWAKNACEKYVQEMNAKNNGVASLPPKKKKRVVQLRF